MTLASERGKGGRKEREEREGRKQGKGGRDGRSLSTLLCGIEKKFTSLHGEQK